MTAQTAMTGRSDAVRTWAVERFNSGGGTIDGLVAVALERFCGDADFVREFVVENLRAEITAGITGLIRTREVQTLYPDSIRQHQPVKTGPVRADGPGPIDADKPPAPAKVRERAKAQPSQPAWVRALAVDPDRRTFRPLLALTREELMSGSEYLAVRSDVLRQIAERLEPGQRVQDRMNERELNDLVAHLTTTVNQNMAALPRKHAATAFNAEKRPRTRLVDSWNRSGENIAPPMVSVGAGEP